MSRTDKTRPFWVKVTDAFVEYHDHENGVCEIKGRTPDRDTITIGWRYRDACHFHERRYDPEMRCGCGLCGIPRSERRRARYTQRSIERSWWREV